MAELPVPFKQIQVTGKKSVHTGDSYIEVAGSRFKIRSPQFETNPDAWVLLQSGSRIRLSTIAQAQEYTFARMALI